MSFQRTSVTIHLIQADLPSELLLLDQAVRASAERSSSTRSMKGALHAFSTRAGRIKAEAGARLIRSLAGQGRRVVVASLAHASARIAHQLLAGSLLRARHSAGHLARAEEAFAAGLPVLISGSRAACLDALRELRPSDVVLLDLPLEPDGLWAASASAPPRRVHLLALRKTVECRWASALATAPRPDDWGAFLARELAAPRHERAPPHSGWPADAEAC